jgi:hypothetical protein
MPPRAAGLRAVRRVLECFVPQAYTMTIPLPFSLLLFSVDPSLIRGAVRAGVEGIVVDWECNGKHERQNGADTEINRHTPDDLRRVRGATDGLVICRINAPHEGSAAEVEEAVRAGADELLVPMVRRVRDVERILGLVRGRCGVGILIETEDAVRLAGPLCALPLSRVYVGLNDLAIDRGAANMFDAVVDGTVADVRRACSVPFGFGGLTRPDAGQPIPCRLLIGEMARMDAQFSFLRRSFHRDMRGRDLDVEVPRLLSAIAAARMRHAEEAARDQRDLAATVEAWRLSSASGLAWA